MLGNSVDSYTINNKAADAVTTLRDGFRKVETLSKWLANHPVVDEHDPLVETFGFAADEAYFIRTLFTSLDEIRLDNAATFELGRKMTGLE